MCTCKFQHRATTGFKQLTPQTWISRAGWCRIMLWSNVVWQLNIYLICLYLFVEIPRIYTVYGVYYYYCCCCCCCYYYYCYYYYLLHTKCRLGLLQIMRPPVSVTSIFLKKKARDSTNIPFLTSKRDWKVSIHPFLFCHGHAWQKKKILLIKASKHICVQRILPTKALFSWT